MLGRQVVGFRGRLRQEDPELEASVELMFSRLPYELSPDHDLPRALETAAAKAGVATSTAGMSCWTDAAILGHAGIPSVLFVPGGAGLHSTEEYVVIADVIGCRDTLTEFVLNSL